MYTGKGFTKLQKSYFFIENVFRFKKETNLNFKWCMGFLKKENFYIFFLSKPH
jgi:hypothetical protein